mgnify:CR=1 FL=1
MKRRLGLGRSANPFVVLAVFALESWALGEDLDAAVVFVSSD